MAIKLIVGRYRGKIEPTSKKILWSMLFNIGSIVSVFIFFAISPFSYYWMMGDIYVTTANLEEAKSYYQTALERLPDSIDVLYEMGKLYRERKEWGKALDYLERAYTQDPSYWGPKAVVLIPDTLMKMGRYEEALKWCKDILKNHPNKIDITRAISKKQDEIIWERDRHK